MSKLNISGIVRGIKAQTTYLTPIIEAVCNSIDSIGKRSDGSIEIIAIRDGQKNFEDKGDASVYGSIIGFDIIDNGVGFTEANRDSFDTYLSGHKYEAGGKGFGRFMYLKYFQKVSFDSYYQRGAESWHRTFDFGHQEEIIENEKNELLKSKDVVYKTTLHLKSAVKGYNADKGLDVIARKLVERLLVFFVDKTWNMPIITLKESDGSNLIVLNDFVGRDNTIQFVQEESFELEDKRHTKHKFTVKTYKVYFSSLANKVILTAHRREVTNRPLHNYVPEFKENMIDLEDGKQKNYAIRSYVIGKYLDDHVDTERGDFSLAHTDDDVFDISVERIEREACLITKKFFKEYILEKFQVKKQRVVDYVSKVAPWNKGLLKDLDLENLPIGIKDLDLELKFQQIKFEKEQKSRIEIHELLDSQQDSNEETFKEQVAELFSKVTEEGKNDLAHYVCSRKKVIDLYNELRKRTDSGKAHLESELHNLFFPMIKNDREVDYEDHNLWLLDERLVFSHYIASDKVISKDDHKEPDIAVFHNEQAFYNKKMFLRNGDNEITSPITIVEFKRPKRENYPDNENPIQQALRYSRKILDGKYEMPDGIEKVKVNKKSTPVYIYIVCDIVDKIREFADLANLSVSSDDEGYFGYVAKFNAYIEVMSFKKVIGNAIMRNKIFFHKLGIE